MGTFVYSFAEHSTLISIIILVLLTFVSHKKHKAFQCILLSLLVVYNALVIIYFKTGFLSRLYGLLVIIYIAFQIRLILTTKEERTLVVDDKTNITLKTSALFQTALKGAKAGDPAAMYNLASFYSIGEGCAVNFVLAKAWARKLIKYPEPFWSQQGHEILEQIEKEERESNKNLAKKVGETIIDQVSD